MAESWWPMTLRRFAFLSPAISGAGHEVVEAEARRSFADGLKGATIWPFSTLSCGDALPPSDSQMAEACISSLYWSDRGR